MIVELPSVKHGLYHRCPYCIYHARTSGIVPSVGQHGWISHYNLLHFLRALKLHMAIRDSNKILMGNGWDI